MNAINSILELSHTGDGYNTFDKYNLQSDAGDNYTYISSSATPPLTDGHPSQKSAFTARFPGINTQYYSALTQRLLSKLYPRICPVCGIEMTVEIKTRENTVRCAQCRRQASRTAYTPLHHLKIPLWTFGYILSEALYRYPQVISSMEIQRRLGCAYNTAALLKRRLQLCMTDLKPLIEGAMREDLNKAWSGVRLPEVGADVTEDVSGKPIVHADGLALFSCSQRANRGRKRHRNTGLTASIYLSDKVALERGKTQIGTLVHTQAIRGGAVILDSVPDLKQQTLLPLMQRVIPANTPVFTDEAYSWLKRYNHNHRAVNHTAKAKDRKRHRWSRQRWCRNGVNNQVAEGFQRNLKHAFVIGYSYISPKFSQMYLNEYAGLKALRCYGLERLLEIGASDLKGGDCEKSTCTIPPRESRNRDDSYLRRRIASLVYTEPSLEERRRLDETSTDRVIRGNLRKMLDEERWFEALQAHQDYLHSLPDFPRYRQQNEHTFNSIANALWNITPRWDDVRLSKLELKLNVNRRTLLRILRRWAALGLAEVFEFTEEKRINCRVRKRAELLPALLYTWDMDEYQNQSEIHPGVVVLETERESRAKYGMDINTRRQILEEIKNE